MEDQHANKRDSKLIAKTLDKKKSKTGKNIPTQVKMLSQVGSGVSTNPTSPHHKNVSFLTLYCSLGETEEEEKEIKEISFLRIL